MHNRQDHPGNASLKAKLANPGINPQVSHMFTIEHEFDATVITLVDEGASPLREDVPLIPKSPLNNGIRALTASPRSPCRPHS